MACGESNSVSLPNLHHGGFSLESIDRQLKSPNHITSVQKSSDRKSKLQSGGNEHHRFLRTLGEATCFWC